MSRLYLIFLAVVLILSSCQTPIPPKYKADFDAALLKSGDNKMEWLKAIKEAPADQREAVVFLISYMPERDLKELKADFILENTRLAFEAREKYTWCKNLPDSIFYNDVLPYVSLNERRDNWRQDFMNRFDPFVAECKTIAEAIDSVNRNILDVVKVEYNTKRKKADQSPYESVEQGMASCTGLSILLTDAFRAVGIPSRIAGTPLWTNMRGNHNWCEVWIDGDWYFTEYYPDALNKSWFLTDAGKADPEKPIHWIYASSYKPTGLSFPCVWDDSIKYVHAENVTGRYIRLYQEQLTCEELQEGEVIVDVALYRNNSSGDQRICSKIEVLKGDEVIDFGYSPSPTDDLNKFLKFKLKKGLEYTFRFKDETGNNLEENLTINAENKPVKLYQTK